jgi:ribonuclease-3
MGWLKRLFGQPATTGAGRGLTAEEQKAVDEFCRHLGVRINRPELLRLALTHRSYLHANDQEGTLESNERLEYLGDSVLGLVCSEWLYRNRPDEHEGQLTKTKSLLVSKAILSRRALAMGLGRFVLLSHSEVESGGRQRLSILADAFEAVIGAIYLDQGLEAARQFIQTWLLNEASDIAADKRHTNYKSLLQEYVQSAFHTHPVYRIRHEAGPDHLKQFTVEVMVGSRTLGDGRGRNKKEAEQSAARDALERVAAEAASRREQGRRSSRGRGGDQAAGEGREPRPAMAERSGREERGREERGREERPERRERREERVREERVREDRVREERPREERRVEIRPERREEVREEREERFATSRMREERPTREERVREERVERVREERPRFRDREERPRDEEAPRMERTRDEAEAVGREERAERPERGERSERGERPERRRGGRGRRGGRDREGREGREPREGRMREERPEREPIAETHVGEPAPVFERVSPSVTHEPEPQAAAAGPAFGRKGKPNKRGAKRDPNVTPPPSAASPDVADVPVATPTRHGPISGSNTWLETDLPRPEVHILESVGATPPGAQTDRYRVAESGPGAPSRRHEGDEEQGREQSA